jgi:hypothetical protein
VNPGPAFVNPGKTIHAPYSQDNVDVFGENAGRQCVAISLYIYIFLFNTYFSQCLPQKHILLI